MVRLKSNKTFKCCQCFFLTECKQRALSWNKTIFSFCINWIRKMKKIEKKKKKADHCIGIYTSLHLSSSYITVNTKGKYRKKIMINIFWLYLIITIYKLVVLLLLYYFIIIINIIIINIYNLVVLLLK